MPYKRSRSGTVRSRRRGWKATSKSKGWGNRRVSVRRSGSRLSAETTLNKTVFREDFITTGLISNTTGVMNVKASLINDISSLVAVYDQYRINYVTVTFIPKYNMMGVTNAGGGRPMSALFGSCIDYDTGTAPTSMAQIADYNNFKFTRGLSIHKRTFKPRPQTTYLVGATNVSSPFMTTTNNPWIDCNQPDVDHYGMRWVVEDTDVESVVYDCMIKINISFKNIH